MPNVSNNGFHWGSHPLIRFLSEGAWNGHLHEPSLIRDGVRLTMLSTDCGGHR